MNEQPDNTPAEAGNHPPDLKPKRTWLRPGELPLVRLFRLIARLARNADFSVSEALAIDAAVYELDSAGQFALRHVYSRNSRITMDDLYLENERFCASMAWQPHSRSRFERLLRLERKDAKLRLDNAGTGAAGSQPFKIVHAA